ncbi:hypothetical protein RIB2604_02006180 [Aspergillus luchuensis]|uniref:WW domain-containing protein n=1 Tax=Aspergillus kawachii TaxID=1069201 RepID=A0A146FJW3_ASPKA|nr:hypothetical protein RIB2604_02006180 [Aspergillus luchuensis]
MPPPPPSVPEGWKAEFDHRYQAWYYINIHTRQSHWERPDQPALPAGPVPPPAGAPPSRETATTTTTTTTTHDRPVGQGGPNPDDHNLPEVYTPQPASQSAYAPNPEQGYTSYQQPQYGYNGYNHNLTYSPYPAYPNQYLNPYQNTYDPSQPPHTQKQKTSLRKKPATATVPDVGPQSPTPHPVTAM